MKKLLNTMREFLNHANLTEQNIIRYVLSDPLEASQLSVHELASKTYSSASTVLRLCRKLGLEGYKDFRSHMAQELAFRQKSLEEQKKEITKMDSLSGIAEKITYKNIVSLEDSLALIDFPTVQTVVDLIVASKNIAFYGIGSSLYVAKDACHKFLRLNKPCVVNDDWHVQLVQARNMTHQDLGFVISYSGQTAEMIECIMAMKENEVPVVSLTRLGESTISRLSDYNLHVAANESLFRRGAMSSRISQLNLIDIVYTAYACQNYEDSLEKLSRTHIHKPQN